MSVVIGFPKMFNRVAGNLRIVTGDEANRQLMKSTLLSSVGELLGDPEFGSKIKQYLFEFDNEFYRIKLKDAIAEAINNHVAEVTVTGVIFRASEYDNHRISIIIQYYSETTATDESMELYITKNLEIHQK